MGPAAYGRVEMWRGGGRLGISVSAPFVWRCLTGAALAPFPVPARQTGRADLSGSSAIAGFCPHRSHRAALPQWALQDGPEADESSVPCLMEGRLRQWEGGQDRLVGRPAYTSG